LNLFVRSSSLSTGPFFNKAVAAALCAGTLLCVSGTASARRPKPRTRVSRALSSMSSILMMPALTPGILPETEADVPADGKPYSLKLAAMHTGESIDIVYRIGNTYIPEALEKLNTFLRDHRTNEVTHYDPKEFDLLHNLMSRLGKPNGTVDIVCGYRTAETNELLREDSPATGVAKHSQHIEGHAIDIRVPGVATTQIRNAALSLEAGGVGYYPKSQFVHVDVGPVRTWTFGATKVKARRGRAGHRATRRRRG
jgi:uncharacterized protein YcbK (DUF882 family)